MNTIISQYPGQRSQCVKGEVDEPESSSGSEMLVKLVREAKKDTEEESEKKLMLPGEIQTNRPAR
jgi:hypothetical protein